VEGFKAKKRFVGERLKQPLLPLLAGGSSSAPYFYEKNASYNLSLIGISEAVEAHTGQRIDRDKIAVDFGLRILEESSKLVKDASEEADMRIRVSQRPGDEAVGRLAELDIEEYGRAVIVADGSRGLFHYTDMPTVPLTAKVPIEIRLRIESKFQSATPGGHLSVICTAPDSSGSGLLKTTEAAFQAGCKFLTYTSNYSACTACGNTDRGTGPKCGKCGSDKLTYIGRASYGLLPFNLWPESKRRSADKRIEYTLAS